MADIKVNQKVWDAITDAEKQQLVAHLQKHGVLQATDSIVADPNTPISDPNTQLYGATIGEIGAMRTLGFGDWICKAACDAAAAAATAACTATGPALAACLVAIAAAREACRKQC